MSGDINWTEVNNALAFQGMMSELGLTHSRNDTSGCTYTIYLTPLGAILAQVPFPAHCKASG